MFFIKKEYNFYLKNKDAILVGVDEVGRGSLFGPVTVGAVALPQNCFNNVFEVSTNVSKNPFFKIRKKHELYGLNDSKKINKKERERLFKIINKNAIFAQVVNINNRIIDKININNATELAIIYLVKRLYKFGLSNINLIVDGNFKLNSLKKIFPKINIESVIKGDSKIISVACASIIAKVKRDSILERMSKFFPNYNLEKNMGYPTNIHRKAILKYGLTSFHRATYGSAKTKV